MSDEEPTPYVDLLYEPILTQSNQSSDSAVAVVMFPMPSRIVTGVFAMDLATIMSGIATRVIVIGSDFPEELSQLDRVVPIDIRKSLEERNISRFGFLSGLVQAARIIFIQLRIAVEVLRIARNVDAYLFYVGGGNLLVPVTASYVLGRRTISFALGSGSQFRMMATGRRTLQSEILTLTEKAIFAMSDLIVVESNLLVDKLNLKNYEHKVVPHGARFVDTSLFKPTTGLKDRKQVIGYVGRIDKGKGIDKLLQAAAIAVRDDENMHFLMVGGGSFTSSIRETLREKGLSEKVTLAGWIPHRVIPEYLNKMKVLVVPSLSEGLPTVVLEAMACGTPVLATRAGAIEEIIQDSKTGFILEDDSPQGIVSGIRRILKSQNTDEITMNARATIEREFNLEAAMDRYRRIIAQPDTE